MRVLQINSVCGIGSTGRIASDIHTIIREKGHESYIAYGRYFSMNCDSPLRIGSKIDTYMHVAKTRLLDKHGLGSTKATREFITTVKEKNPDLIHLHNIHGYYINFEILFEYLKEAKKPIIWTLHDCWAFTGHCSYFSYVGCSKWKTGCHNCPQKKSYPVSIFMDKSKFIYSKKKELFTSVENMIIVTPSNWLAGLVSESFLGIYPRRVINNGIDLEIFKPTESDFRHLYNIKNKFLILGVASDWNQRKGYEYFIQLSKIIKEDEIIVMVGLTERQIREIPENIIGISKTNNIKQLAEIYSAADVFLNPTLEDNFPTTNLESLACGTPVITFNTGGSVESIDDSCGAVVEQGNFNELIMAINKIRENKKDSIDCVKRSKLYDKNDKFNEYINQYLSLCK